MKADIFIAGEIGKDTTLLDVIRQFKSYDDVTEMDVHIDSIGGYVEEGEKIFNYLEALKTDITITTITSKAYSIAAQLFAVGEHRIIIDGATDPLMIHLPWASATGGAEYFEDIAIYLKGIGDRFVSFYSELLDIDSESVAALLDSETFISADDAISFGFATEVKKQKLAVAIYDVNSNINKSNIKMDKKEKGVVAFLKKVLAECEKPEVKAELTLQDSNLEDVVFPDLEIGDIPSVGDKATVDGKAIDDTSRIIPSLDSSTVVFKDGKIESITEKEEDEVIEAEKAAKAAAEKAAKAEQAQEISTWSITIVDGDYKLGDTVKRPAWDGEGEDAPIGAGEYRLEDGRVVVTDSAGEIVKVTPAPTGDSANDTVEASYSEVLTELTNKISKRVEASFTARLSEASKEIETLKGLVKSEEINSSPRGERSDSKSVILEGESKAMKYVRAAKK